jgi:hypothetical protein
MILYKINELLQNIFFSLGLFLQLCLEDLAHLKGLTKVSVHLNPNDLVLNATLNIKICIKFSYFLM